ncbi:MAG: phage tail tape measure protein [Treponema lecithinolyticum]|uniref:phage tail tape measure protein n=1 Tax=Treponema lecithinolyticum TaxID=53418 RepID=UPI0036195FA8
MPAARELVFKIIGNADQLKKAIDESNKKLDDFTQKTKDANELFGKVAKQATIATTAIAALGVAAAKLAIDFNQGFGAVQTLIPGATERIKELQKNVLELSPAVGKTTKDLTDGLYEIISAFGDSADSAKNLELAAKGATAGGATTKDAIALLSAVTKAYGDTTNVAQKKVSDLAFTTVKLGQTNFPELAASMQRVTSMSKTLGVSQEEMFAVFSSGTGVIGGAAEVATKLSAVYTELQKPQDRLQEAFEKLGVATGSELLEKFDGFAGAMQALKSVAEETGEPVSNLFGSAQAGKLALYAAGEGAAKFKSDLEAMHDALGATEQAFNDATVGGPNKFGFQLQQARLNLEAFATKIGQELIPSLQNLLTPAFKFAEVLKNLNEDQLQLVISAGKILITATSLTAGLFGLSKGIIAAQKAAMALNAAFKVIGLTNPFVLAIAGAAAAVVALKEVAAWADRVAEKQHKARLAGLDASTAESVRAQRISELAQAYATLNEKEKLTNAESLKMKELVKEINEIIGSGFLTTHEASGKTTIDEDNAVVKARKVAQEKKEELEYKKKALEQLLQAEEELQKRQSEVGKRAARDTGDTLQKYDLLPQSIKNIKKTQEAVEQLQAEAEKLKANISETEKGIAALMDFSQKDFTPNAEPEVKNDETGKDENAAKNSQAKRLADLQKEFAIEKRLLKDRKLSTQEEQAELTKIEESFYKKRLELLKTFHKENTTQILEENGNAVLTFEQSLSKAVGESGQSIQTETQNTYAALDVLAEARHKKELDRINSITETTKKQIDDEIALKEKLGQYTGNKKEIERTKTLEKQKALLKKQNELMEEYLRLSESGSEKDKEKAAATLQQAKNLGEASAEAGKELKKSFAEATDAVAGMMQKIGNIITDTMHGIADIAKTLISQKETRRQQETAETLASINRERNQKLLEIDNELSDMREQKQAEDAERDELRRQEEYEKKVAAHERDLAELEGNFAQETNIIKLREIEKQIEAERKKKAEEAAQKKADDEKKKHDKETRQQEVAMLNARTLAEHQYATQRIAAENAAGVAGAKSAQEKAKWEKAEAIVSLSVKAAVETAASVAAFAANDPIGGVAHAAAAVIAGVQAGVAGQAPAPPDYIQQPLPPAPRLIKFAAGGIVMPSSSGTGITLPHGSPALAGEAGNPELIMPITAPNLERMFRAAGVQNTAVQNQLSYAPSYNLTFSHNMQDSADVVMNVLKSHDRELFAVVEKARQNWFME